MAIEKYRVRDVARDFGFPAKVITDILGKYGEAPKSNMQALEDKELSVIFEHLTQNNQISSIAAIYADEPKKPESAPAPKAEAAPKAEPAHKARRARQARTGRHRQSPPCLSRRRSRRPSSRLKSPRSRWCSSPSRSTASPRPLPSPPPAYRRRSWWTPARAAT